MSDRTISATLKANVAQYIAAMAKAKAATSGMTDGSSRNFSQLGSSMQSFGGQMTKYVTTSMITSAAGAVAMAAKFETSFAQMEGLAGVASSDIDGLKDSVLSLAGETAVAPQELADALYFAASAGLSTADAMDALSLAAHASAAGMGSTQDVVGLVASAMASYGAANIDAATATDILTSTIREGRADPAELAGSLGRILPVAASLGISFQEVGGATAYLSNIMGDTGRTVTSMNGIMNALASPSAAAKQSLLDMGTSAEELRAAIGADGLTGALELLRTHGYAGNSEALSKLFQDNEAYAGALALVNDESGTLNETMGAVAASAGSLDTAFSAVADTSAFKMKQAFTEIKVAMITVGDILLPIAANIGSAIAGIVQWFSELDPAVQTVVVAFGGLVAAAGPMLILAGSLIKSFEAIKVAMAASSLSAGPLGLALVGIGIAVGIVALAMSDFKGKQDDTGGSTVAAGQALRGATDEAWKYVDSTTAAGDSVDGLTVAQIALNAVLTDGSASGEAFRQALGSIGLQTSDALNTLILLGTTVDDTVGASIFEYTKLAEQMGYTGIAAAALGAATGATDPSDIDANWHHWAETIGVTDAELYQITGNMRAVALAANEYNAEDLATQYLNEAVALSAANEANVDKARAMAEANGQAGDSVAVYENYLGIIAALPEAEQNAALGLDDVTAAGGAAAGALDAAAAAAQDAYLPMSELFLLMDEAGGTKGDYALEEHVKGIGTAAQGALPSVSELFKVIADSSKGTLSQALPDYFKASGQAAQDAYLPMSEIFTMIDQSAKGQMSQALPDFFKASGQAAQNAYLPMSEIFSLADNAKVPYEDTGKFADALGKVGDEASDAQGSLEKVADAVDHSADAFDTAASAANDFRDALDHLVNPAMDVAESERAVWATIRDATAAYEENGDTLDSHTEAGAANLDMIDQSTAAFRRHSEKMIANGASIEDATSTLEFNTGSFIDNLVAIGYNRDAVTAYLRTLHLLPSQVATEMRLPNIMATQGNVQGYHKSLLALPTSISSTVQAHVSGVAAVKAALDSLTYTRYATIYATTYTKTLASAAGRFIPGGSNLLTTTAEIPGRRGDEVILPLGDPSRMAALLSMSEVGPRVMAALSGLAGNGGGKGSSGSSGGTAEAAGGDTYNVVVHNNGRDITPHDVAQAINEARRAA